MSILLQGGFQRVLEIYCFSTAERCDVYSCHAKYAVVRRLEKELEASRDSFVAELCEVEGLHIVVLNWLGLSELCDQWRLYQNNHHLVRALPRVQHPKASICHKNETTIDA